MDSSALATLSAIGQNTMWIPAFLALLLVIANLRNLRKPTHETFSVAAAGLFFLIWLVSAMWQALPLQGTVEQVVTGLAGLLMVLLFVAAFLSALIGLVRHYQRPKMTRLKGIKRAWMVVASAVVLFFCAAGFAIYAVAQDAVIDRQAATPLPEHVSKTQGFTIQPLPGWRKWIDMDEDAPTAATGFLKGKNSISATAVFPIGLQDFQPGLPAMLRLLEERFGIQPTDESIEILDHRVEGDVEEWKVACAKTLPSDPRFDYRLRFIKAPKRAFIVAAWTISNTPENIAELNRTIDSFTLLDSWEESAFPPRARDLNEFGIYYGNNGDYQRAYEYYQAAVEAGPAHPTIIDNAAYMAVRLENPELALEILEQEAAASHSDCQHTKAIALNKLERLEESFAAWQNAISLGEENVGLWQGFIDFAQHRGLAKKAVKFAASKEFAKENHDIRLRFARLVLDAEGLDAALTYLDAAEADGVDGGAVLNERLQTLYRAKEYRRVIEMVDSIESRDPLWYKFASLKGHSQWVLERYAEARNTFQSILNIRPNDADAISSIHDLSALIGKGDNLHALQPIEPVPIPEWLPAPSEIPPPPAGIDAWDYEFLDWTTACFFKQGEPSRRTSRQIIRLNTPSAVEDYNIITATFRHLTERIYLNKLQVRDEKGELLAEADPDSCYILDKNDGNMAVSERVLHIPVPGLKPGVVLDFEITRCDLRAASEFRYQDFDFRRAAPAGRIAFVMQASEADYKAHMTPGVESKAVDGIRAWWSTSADRKISEPNSPDYSLIYPNLRIGPANAGWEEESIAYFNRISTRLEAGPATIEKAKELTAGTNDEMEKLTALVRFVQDAISYTAIEFGTRGIIPEPADRTLANRYGDCKDMAVLLRALLAAVDIPSHLVLVNGIDVAVKEVPTLDQFDHVILCVNLPDRLLFIDPTDTTHRLIEEASHTWVGHEVLVLDPEKPRWERIPAPSLPATAHVHRTIKPVAGERLHVVDRVRVTGYPAGWMRGDFRSKSREEWNTNIRRYLESGGEIAVVNSFTIDGLNDSHAPIEFEVAYTTSQIPAQSSVGGGISFQIPIPWERYFLDISQNSPRQLPFHKKYAMDVHSKLTIDGWKPVTAEKINLEFPSDVFTWRVDDPDFPVASWSARIDTGLWDPEEYNAVVSSVNSLLTQIHARGNWESITLDPPLDKLSDAAVMGSGNPAHSKK